MENNQTKIATNKQIEKYIESLSPIEKQTIEIAKDHLKTSFNMEKSIGFLAWKKLEDNK
jgi:hypothetical protein